MSTSDSPATTSAGEHLNRGVALYQSGQREAAVATLSQAIELDPSGRWAAQALSNRGVILAELHRLDDALPDTQRAVELQPRNAELLCNHAIVLGRHQRWADALPLLRQAIALSPRDPFAHALLGLVLLNLGEMTEGLREFEWRQRHWNTRKLAPRTWDGSPLAGKTIFLRAEQGFGDTIQFIRYAPLLCTQRGAGRVLVECQPELKSLVREVPGIDGVFTPTEATPPADFEIWMMSLAERFGATWDNIRAEVPYLRPNPSRLAHFAPQLAEAAKGKLKVGLNWGGNADFQLDRTRSTQLAVLTPLLQSAPGVTWISIQKGAAYTRDAALIRKLGMIDLGAQCRDFADTATAMSLLDLVITTDTAPAHLAGAVARPTWLLLEYFPEWRWGRDRSESPWYPTMRLFRQQSLGDWSGVVEQVAAGLSDRVNSSGGNES